MILPTKHISHDRALLTVGANILKELDGKKTVSALWENTLSRYNFEKQGNPGISYDWFILALDLLYAMDTIEFDEGLLYRRKYQ